MTFSQVHQMCSYVELAHRLLLKIRFPCTLNAATRVQILFHGLKLY